MTTKLSLDEYTKVFTHFDCPSCGYRIHAIEHWSAIIPFWCPRACGKRISDFTGALNKDGK